MSIDGLNALSWQVKFGAINFSMCRTILILTQCLLLLTNPGIRSIEQAGEDYVAELTPISFPGLQVSSSVRFSSQFNGSALAVTCKPDGLQLRYEGIRSVTRLVENFIPSVASENLCSFDISSGLLVNEASLSISFSVPGWFPIPVQVLEQRGSAVIRKGLEKDMIVLLDSLMDQFSADEDIVE
eukprot:gene24883-30062_t